MAAIPFLNLNAGTTPQLSADAESTVVEGGEVTDFRTLLSGQFSRDDLKALLQRLREEGGRIDPGLLQALQQVLEDGKDLPFSAISLPLSLPAQAQEQGLADNAMLLDLSSGQSGRSGGALQGQMRELLQAGGAMDKARQGQTAGLLDALPGEQETDFDLDLAGLDLRLSAASVRLDKAPIEAQLSSLARMTQVPVRVGDTGWHQAVADRVVWMIGKEQQAVQLKLNPAHLGPMEVRLSLHQDQATVSFLSGHAAVREALEQAVPRLRDMLGQQDIQLVQVNVDQRQGHDSQGAGQGDAKSASAGGANNLDTQGSQEETQTVRSALVRHGLVDTYA